MWNVNATHPLVKSIYDLYSDWKDEFPAQLGFPTYPAELNYYLSEVM